jgi:hypothetical protein
MIICTVCGESNEDLAITCTKCHSFLQAKVDTVDLFATIWGLIESPGRTLRKIVLAKHKNYAIVLLMLLGIAMTLALVSYLELGRKLPYGVLIGIGVAAGAPLGIVFGFVASSLVKAIARILGGKGSQRNLRSILAFAAVPIIFLLVIVYPLQFGIFGKFLFDHNPPPWVYEPTIYYILLTLSGLALLWAIVLYGMGVAIACSFTKWKGMIAALILTGLVVGGAVALRSL